MVGAFSSKLDVLAKGKVEVKIFAADESRTPDLMLLSIAPLRSRLLRLDVYVINWKTADTTGR